MALKRIVAFLVCSAFHLLGETRIGLDLGLIIPYSWSKICVLCPLCHESWGFPGLVAGSDSIPSHVWAPGIIVSNPSVWLFSCPCVLSLHMYADQHSAVCVWIILFLPLGHCLFSRALSCEPPTCSAMCYELRESPRLCLGSPCQAAAWKLKAVREGRYRAQPVCVPLSGVTVLCYLLVNVLKSVVSFILSVFWLFSCRRVNLGPCCSILAWRATCIIDSKFIERSCHIHTYTQ